MKSLVSGQQRATRAGATGVASGTIKPSAQVRVFRSGQPASVRAFRGSDAGGAPASFVSVRLDGSRCVPVGRSIHRPAWRCQGLMTPGSQVHISDPLCTPSHQGAVLEEVRIRRIWAAVAWPWSRLSMKGLAAAASVPWYPSSCRWRRAAAYWPAAFGLSPRRAAQGDNTNGAVGICGPTHRVCGRQRRWHSDGIGGTIRPGHAAPWAASPRRRIHGSPCCGCLTSDVRGGAGQDGRPYRRER
jgi:hypothetical protein